jgi:predicted Zn-dependent protease
MSRREQLEAMLAEDPNDAFLNYALAMEEKSAGNPSAALARLTEMESRFPDQVAAYFQRGQILSAAGESEAAAEVLHRGIAVARRVGDLHAAGEMQGLLDLL